MDMAEYPMDILVNHQNFVRALLCFKGICKGDHKPPHMMWVGAMAAGKSHLANSILGKLMPPGILVTASNVSAQAFYAEAPCTETHTGQRVFYYDEADAVKLGLGDKKNSTVKESTQYKERLTNRSTTSTVLTKDANEQRQVSNFEISNDNVQVRREQR
jgi:hypothetical protein